jgi:hypothetical protein
LLAQNIRIALAGLPSLDEVVRNHLLDLIVSMRESKGNASHLESQPHDALGLGIELVVV